jgi:hypothetical protein
MNFIIRDEDGELHGPVDLETLQKWVEMEKVFPDTPVRNELFPNWREARKLHELDKYFEEQAERLEENKGFWKRTGEVIDSGMHSKKKKEQKTAFKYEYLPNPASVPLRVCAAVFDGALLLAFALILYIIGATIVYTKASNTTFDSPRSNSIQSLDEDAALELKEKRKEKLKEQAETKATNTEQNSVTDKKAQEGEEGEKKAEKAEEKLPPAIMKNAIEPPGKCDDQTYGYAFGSTWYDQETEKTYNCLSAATGSAVWVLPASINEVFYVMFFIFAFVTILYYAFSLGFYAQTFGMWFWGIFITRPDKAEVLPGRAYIFGLLSILIGWLTPFILYLNPAKCALHDLISGVRVIRISAKPKA